MDYIIEKTTQIETYPSESRVEKEIYNFKYTKTMKTVAGEDVIVIDDSRIEQVTVAQLEGQKAQYQKAILDIDARLLEIAKL